MKEDWRTCPRGLSLKTSRLEADVGDRHNKKEVKLSPKHAETVSQTHESDAQHLRTLATGCESTCRPDVDGRWEYKG